MGQDYQDWLAKSIKNDTASDFKEYTVAEMVDMMKALPVPGTGEEGWN